MADALFMHNYSSETGKLLFTIALEDLFPWCYHTSGLKKSQYLEKKAYYFLWKLISFVLPLLWWAD